MRTSIKFLGAMLVCGLIAVSIGAAKDKDSKHGGVAVGDAAPTFSLQDTDGKTINLSDLKGKTVVLEWFNATCPVVVRHHKAKTMTTLADKYKDKDVVWLAVDWRGA